MASNFADKMPYNKEIKSFPKSASPVDNEFFKNVQKN